MSGVLWRRVFVAGLLAIYAGLSLSTICRKSATWDETRYLGVGRLLTSHSIRDIPSAILHPPLSYYIHSLPLLFCDLDQRCIEKGRSSDVLAGTRRGQCLMRNSTPSGDTLLFLARVPMIGVGVLLGWFVYLFGSALYGTGGGLVSLFLYCLSPNILAHSGLITTDLCLSAFGFITVYSFWRNTRSPSATRLLLSGVALGLTLLSKHTGLLWVPILALLAVLHSLLPEPTRESRNGFLAAGPVVHLGVVLLLAFVVLFLGTQLDLSAYLFGLEEQKRIIGNGFPSFLNGEVRRSGGWWYYYLFAFLIKVPIPTLLLLAASIFAPRGKSGEGSATLWLLTPVLMIFAAFSFMSQANVGLRYVLPAFPFLMVFAGRVALLVKRIGHAGVVVLFALLAWVAVESGSIHPHHLSYFNQIAGGPRNGHRYLVDSNVDWGQDLKTLKRYMDEKGIQSIKLSYFGSVDPRQYGIDFEPLPSFLRIPGGRQPTPLRKGDLVAVSATNLYPLYVDLGGLAEHLRSISPVAHAGSILLYRLERDMN